jgi:hypothetical protein
MKRWTQQPQRNRSGGKSRLLLLILLLSLPLISCGSDESEPEIAPLTISIDTPSQNGILVLSTHEESLALGGNVAESPLGKKTTTVCNCYGFGCFFDPQCFTVYVPRVRVTLTNQDTGESLPANISFSTNATNETWYQWSATVSLVFGDNRLMVVADDGAGAQGRGDLLVRNP